MVTAPRRHPDRVVILLAAVAFASCGCSAPPSGAGPDGGPFGGTGGAGGLGGGAGGAGGAGAVCGTGDTPGGRLDLRTYGLPDLVYDGPAIVERSDGESLTLYFMPPAADAGSSLPMHVQITQPAPMPTLPVGARVWLSKMTKGIEQPDLFTAQPWGLSVRNREGGDLLFGYSHDLTAPPYAPVAVGPQAPICTAPSTECPGYTVTYGAADVLGDRAVRVHNGETAVVPIGGVDYDVRLRAHQAQRTDASFCGGDFRHSAGVGLDVRPRDLAPLAAGLTVEPLPSCTNGNAAGSFAPDGSLAYTTATDYDGPIRYLRGQAGALYFSLDDLPATSADRPSFRLIVRADVLPTPAADATFWLTLRASPRNWVLRAREGGEVLLAAGGSAEIARDLGVAVGFEMRCEYSDTNQVSDAGPARYYLSDALVGTPPVRVPSGTIAPMRLGDRDYSVLASGLSLTRAGGWLSVWRR